MAKDINIYLGETELPPYHIHTTAQVYANVNLLILGQLIESVDGFRIKPKLLDNFYYDIKTDKYVLKLKEGLKFHNGREVTSKDLEFTLLRGFYSSDKSFFHTYLGNIKGVRKIKKGDLFKSGSVEGLQIKDNLTVEISLIGPNPSLFHSLSAPYFSLVPIEALDNDYLSWKKYPIGAGDYKVTKAFDGEKTKLKKFGKDAKFENVTLYSKLNSDIDFAIDYVKGLNPFYSKLPFAVRILEFSNKHSLGRDKKFQRLINGIMEEIDFSDNKISYDSASLLPKHFWGHHKKQKQKVNIEKLAKEYKNKEIASIVYTPKEFSERHLFYMNKIKDKFIEYGLSIKFIANSEKFVSKETAEKYPLSFSGMIADYVDPLIMYSAYRKIGHNIHYSPAEEILDEYEELYLKAEKAKTFDERLVTVKELNKFSQENIVQVPIAEEKMVYYINPKTIKTLGEQPNPLTIDINRIEMK